MGNILELRNITKNYPGVKALDHVSAVFNSGETHAIMGENGAGKSTLIKIISGAVQPNGGTIIFEGKEYTSMNPTLTKKLGIGVIYQEFNLVPELSIAENIFLGRKLTAGPTINEKQMNEKAKVLMDRFGLNMDVTMPVKNLTVAYQQLVEITKAISNDVKVLIMDEPSAPLTNREIDVLFGIIEKIKKQGVAIIYISHRIEEIFRISDRVTIMRDGTYIDTKLTADTNTSELISLMVGRKLEEQYPTIEKTIGETVFEVRDLCTPVLKHVSLHVRKGEILGLAGLVGAGRTETARAIFGADPVKHGEIVLHGEVVRIRRPRDAINAGIALIPEDRKKQGVQMGMTIRENISFIFIRKLSRFGVVNMKKDRELSKDFIRKLNIRTPSMEQQTNNLSGGNQQKVVLAKSLSGKSDVIIFDEPTRGIDVGAKQEIYILMNQLAQDGMAIIMISSDMPELLGMSDRILVMHEGQISGELNKEEATQAKVLELASGIRQKG